jgi:hypothetical protein
MMGQGSIGITTGTRDGNGEPFIPIAAIAFYRPTSSIDLCETRARVFRRLLNSELSSDKISGCVTIVVKYVGCFGDTRLRFPNGLPA